MQDTKTIKKRKSAPLTSDEKKALKKFVNKYPSITEAADNIPILRNVLDRILLVGSGSPENIGLVREKLKQVA